MPKISDRLQHAWNAFRYGEADRYRDRGPGYYYQPNRSVRRISTERSIVMAIYNRIAIDVSNISIKHVRLDENGRYIKDINSGLNNCLQLEANIDQSARAFMQDVVLSMLEEGVVAVVPVDTDLSPVQTGSYDILTMRTGKIIQWYPEDVLVNLYDERTGLRKDVLLPKTMVAIIENPFYAVMNEPNSTLQRLIRKLNLLDDIDEQSGSGKLDLIIQLPYTIKSEARRKQAEERRKDIEMQLAGTKYGIAYTDATEHVTQLNRSVENNLMGQIEYLTSMLYSQLGMTEDVLKGTADEKTNLNYINSTIEPIVSTICNEYKRTFLTKWARTQNQSIQFFKEPFKLVPVDNLAEIADKFTRNEIMSSNEFRQIIGMKPSDDPRADQLRNSNMPQSDLGMESQMMVDENGQPVEEEPVMDPEQENADYQSGLDDLDELERQLKELEDELNHSSLGGEHLAHYASPYYDPVYAHEYYMKHRKLKGRSTSGLNDEGKAAAYQVKTALQEEKKRKISESNERKKAGIAASQASTKSRIKSSSDYTKGVISRSSEQTKNQIKLSSAQKDAKIKAERENVKSKIAQHKQSMQTKISSLQAQLKVMTKAQKAEAKERIQEQIASLREENSARREELNSAYSEFSTKTREEHRSRSEELRRAHKSTSEKAREEHKSTSEKAREEHKSKSEKLREEHKANTEKAKKDYEDKLDTEMEKIHNEASFQQVKKAKSSGGRRSSGGSSKKSSKKTSSGKDYSAIITAYKKRRGLIK